MSNLCGLTNWHSGSVQPEPQLPANSGISRSAGCSVSATQHVGLTCHLQVVLCLSLNLLELVMRFVIAKRMDCSSLLHHVQHGSSCCSAAIVYPIYVEKNMFPYYSMRHGDIIVSSSCPIKWATVTQMLIWIRIPLLQNHNWQLCSQVISIYRQDMVIATRFSNEVRSACKYLLRADALYVPWLVESIFWGIHTKSLSWPRTPCIQYMMK